MDLRERGVMKIPVVLNSVNIPKEVGIYGIEEAEDVVRAYYSAAEAYEKSMADGLLSASDLVNAGGFVMNLFSAFDGYKQAEAEFMELDDSEIATLVNLSDEFELGAKAEKYRQILKTILTAVQTYSVFKK